MEFKMKKTLLAIALASTALCSLGDANAASPAAAAEYTQFLPMNKVVSASVRDCRGEEGSNVKYITWGADLILTYANGNSKETKADSIMANEGLNLKLRREDDFVKQVEGYLRCDTPYLRATQGQANMAAAVTESTLDS
jgi:hypothetical protein